MHSLLSSGWVLNGKGLSAKQSFSRRAESRWWKWVFFPFILWSFSIDGVGFSKLKVCAWISQPLIHKQVFSSLGSYQFLPVCSLRQRPLWPRTELGMGDIILCAVKTSSGLIYGTVFLSLPLCFADSSAHTEILPLETASPNRLLRTGSLAPQGMSHALQENFSAISYFLWVCLDGPHLCYLLVHTVTWLSSPGSPPDSPRTFHVYLFTFVKSCSGQCLLGESCSYELITSSVV